MKIPQITSQIALLMPGVLLGLLLIACKKQPEISATPESSPLVGTNRVDTVITTNVDTNVTHSLTQALQTIPEVSSNVTAQVKEAADAANQRFLSLVLEVQDFIKQNKFAEAGQRLTEFSKISLTPDQQQLVNQLKADVEKGLTNQVGQAMQQGLSNILGGAK